MEEKSSQKRKKNLEVQQGGELLDLTLLCTTFGSWVQEQVSVLTFDVM